MNFIINNFSDIILKIGEHLFISLSAIGLGTLFALPIGLLISQNKKISNFVIGVSSVLQTVPSLALLAIMVPIFGVGKLPAIIALFIYSLLPILRNTVLGMESVNADMLDAAKGMGMTKSQIMFHVQIPLSVEVIMSGIRLSSIYVIAWASLAAYIGAGGLGDYIFNGLNNFNFEMIIVGTVPITLMALGIDYLLEKLETKLVPNFTSRNNQGSEINEI